MRLVGALWVGCLVVAACDDGRQPTSRGPRMTASGGVAQRVDARGGKVLVDSGPAAGASVEVPAGATDADLEISIDPADALPTILPAGPAVELGPDGAEFAVPVVVTLPYTDVPTIVVSEPGDLVVTARRRGGGMFQDIPPLAVDLQAHSVSVETTHFSTYQARYCAPTARLSATLERAEPGGASGPGDEIALVFRLLLDGSPAPLEPVRFVTDGAGSTLAPEEARTDDSGQISIRLSAAASGTQHLSARLGCRAEVEIAGLDLPIGVPAPPPVATRLRYRVEPSAAVAGEAIAPAVVVEIVDAAGQVVPNATLPVTLQLAGGGLAGTLTRAPEGGVASFPDLAVTRAGQALVLEASAQGLPSATSAPFDVAPAAAETLRFVAEPQGTTAGQTLAPAPELELLDRFGNRVGVDTPVTLTLAGGALLGTTTLMTSGGAARFDTLRIEVAGRGYALVAAAPMLPQVAMATSAAFDVAPGMASALRVLQAPMAGVAGQRLAPAAVVEVDDAFGNAVTDSTAAITIALAGGPTGVALGGTLTRSPMAGLATYDDLTIDRAAPGYLLRATSPGLAQADSAAFAVSPDAAVRLAYRTLPAAAAAGTALAAVEVEAQDALGNVAPVAASVTLALATNPGGAALQGTTSIPLSAGAARFSDLRIDVAAAGYTLEASAGALTRVTSAPFSIGAAAPARLAVGSVPASVVAGQAIAWTVRIQDAFGNPVTTATNAVDVALGTNPAGATLAGTRSIAAVAGVASFADLRVDRVGTGYVLAATASGLTGGSSSAFAVTPGAPASLAFSTQPSAVIAGTVMAPAVRVSVQDAFGNVAAGASSVSLALGNNPAGATLGGTLTAPVVAGTATFADLTIDRAAVGNTLVASSAGAPSATSSAFTSFAAGPVRLAFVGQPGTTFIGLPVSVTVEAQDALGARATGFSGTVTLALGNNPSGATLGGTLSVPAVAGVATVSGMDLDRAGVGYTLTGSASGLTSATSASFDVTAYQAADGAGHLDGTDMSLSRGLANDAPSASTLNNPEGIAIDTARHLLYVSEQNNHRVLVFNLSAANDFTGVDRAADLVLGQPDFGSSAAGTSATTFDQPHGLGLDTVNNRLFVADRNNNRVLVFDTTALTSGMAATRVLGQPGFGTSSSGAAANQMNDPYFPLYDAATGRLLVSDRSNNRVLVFLDASPAALTSGMAASLAIGQSGFGQSGAATARDRFDQPRGLAFDGGSRLYVADNWNHRVLVFNWGALATGMLADNVLGQPDFTSNGSGASATSLDEPKYFAYEGGTGRLFVSDHSNHRVLVFDTQTLTNGMAASRVLGQSDLVSGGLTAVSATSMNQAKALALVGSRLWLADSLFNRVTVYDVATVTDGEPAIDGLGHLAGGVMDFSNERANDVANRQAFSSPSDVAVDTTAHRAYLVDSGNHRVLGFDLTPGDLFGSGAAGDRVADLVVGQTAFGLNSSGCTPTATGLCNPQRVLVDRVGGRLFVADTGNHRVLAYDLATLSSGAGATLVLGQASLSTNAASSAATGLSSPLGLAITSDRTLLVADSGNNRVVGYALGSVATGMAATVVLGQPGFGSSGAATTASGMSAPRDVAVDTASGRVFVADAQNHRVLAFSGTLSSGMSAANVLGQASLTSGAPGLTRSTMNTPSGLSVDASRLFVSDQANNRVLTFGLGAIADGANATSVIGQPGFATSATSASPQTLASPVGIESAGGRLWVCEGANHRLSLWSP